MPDAAAQRAVAAAGLTPARVRAQARRWALRAPPLALRAEYYRALSRALRVDQAALRADPLAAHPFDSARYTALVREFGRRTLRWNARKYETPLGVALGLSGSSLVRTDALDPDLESRALESWTRENVALIKGVTDAQIERVTAAVYRAQRSGTRAVDLQDEIATIMGSALSRAKVIARDQIGKFNGQLDRLKQTQAGIDAYVWRSSGGELVRPKHVEHNGQRYTWDSPPADGHPGQPVQCRCGAEPDLSGLLGRDFAPENHAPSAAAVEAQARLQRRRAARAARRRRR